MEGIEETGQSSRERVGNEGPSGGIIIYKTLPEPVPTTVCQGIRLENKCMSMHLNANANVLVTHLQMHLN